MSFANIIMGIMIASGFFVSAAVGHLFRRSSTGIVIGGVTGLAVSVVVLVYGLNNVFEFGPAVVEN
jgi:hypothetical protein